MSRTFELRRELVLPRPPGEVFAFFSDPWRLEEITPPWMRFRVLDAPRRPLRAGDELRYRLRVRGVPLRWTSRIAVWDPPRGFVDEQVRGPYRSWVHAHAFAPVAGGTRVEDHVRYAVPGGALVDRLLVRPDLERVFDFRARVLRERFGASAE